MNTVLDAAARLRAAGRVVDGVEVVAGAAAADHREAAVAAKPPGGNTGGKFTELELGEHLTIKIDWLSVVFLTENRNAVLEEVGRYLGEHTYHPSGIHGYQKSWRWEEFGAVLAWSDGRPDALLSMNGRSIDQVHISQQLAFLKSLEDIGVRCSRLDIALDDHLKRVLPDDIEREFEAGHVVGYRLGTPHRPKRREKGVTITVGASFDLGRRGSDGSGKFLQVYDKTLESDGEIDAVRWELRLAKEAAETAFECLASSRDTEALRCKLSRYIGGCVDFRSDPQLKNVDRRTRLLFWEFFVSILGAAELKIPRQRPPLQRSLEHVRRAYARLFAKADAVLRANGLNPLRWFESIIEEGRAKTDFSRLNLDEIDIGALMGERRKHPEKWSIDEVKAAMGLGSWCPI